VCMQMLQHVAFACACVVHVHVLCMCMCCACARARACARACACGMRMCMCLEAFAKPVSLREEQTSAVTAGGHASTCAPRGHDEVEAVAQEDRRGRDLSIQGK